MDKYRALQTSKFATLVAFLALVLFLFIINVLIRRYSEQTLVDASLFVFTLLGVILTAGAAFATVAAIISYISINDKLKKSEENLKEIESKVEANKYLLNEIDELRQKKQALVKDLDQIDDYQVLLKELDKSHKQKNSDKTKEAAKRILAYENASFLDKVKANAILAELDGNDLKEKDWENAIGFYQDSMKGWETLFLFNKEKYVENYVKSAFNLAYCYSQQENNLRILYKINELYNRIMVLQSRYNLSFIPDIIYYNWGNDLSSEASLISEYNPQEAKKLCQQAKEKYKTSIELNPKNSKAYNNLGNVLNGEAKLILKDNPQGARKLFQQASEKYKRAIELNPENSKAYNNLGFALHNEANFIGKDNPQKAEKLFQQAKEMCVKAIKIEPDYQTAYNNLEEVLSKLDDFLGKEKKQDYWQKVQEEIMLLPDAQPKQDMLKFIEKQISSAKENP